MRTRPARAFSISPSVAVHKLQNYLRTYRKRAGLSQDEVAFLLGAQSGAKVSRYENFARQPSVNTVFAYEVVFNQPTRELFAGGYHSISLAVRARAERLVKRLGAQSPGAEKPRMVRKLHLLRSIVDSKSSSAWCG